MITSEFRSFVFFSFILKCTKLKERVMQPTPVFVWLWTFISHTKRRTKIRRVWEYLHPRKK